MAKQAVPYVRTVAELRALTGAWRAAGETVALVPTMGALHDGHLSLVRSGQAACRRVVTSIFVNPAQFAPTEDFGDYPRTFDSDLAKLATAGCDLVWAPTADVMYPEGFATMITPKGAALGLETDFRPHFFQGVATVCCKLFTQTQADVAVFGQKDYQQLCVIQQLVRDLDLPLSIIGAETVREADGLAMSSRNAYLDPAQRQVARHVSQALQTVAKAVREGRPAAASCKSAADGLLAAGFASVDYLVVRDAGTLAEPLPGAAPGDLRVLVAAWLGKTRLIDNISCG
ncbi:MAG TPA: pantoate--beta-alanine ligase [Hyphomicrobiaceae bacterium]|nr:pantoate--beta-alanine ligase [Hyphomicrobiaceae bacterium]